MATKFWEPKAVEVAQISTVQITAVDATPADNTFTITIGGVAVSVVGDTDVNTTALNLKTALVASTHLYFTNVTWTQATDTVTGTAGTAGVPFVAVSSVTGGGTGTIGAVTESTAATGPNFWDDADNWSTGVIPVSTDDVILRDSAIPICWGLAQDAVALTSLTIDLSYTGKIGLRGDQFATSADAVTTEITVPEYRQTYLDIEWDDCDIGQHLGPGTPTGSTRLRLDNDKAGASNTRIHGSASNGDGNKASILLLFTNASADIEVRDGGGGVGIGTGIPGETATFGDLTITDTSAASRVYIGAGVTYTNYTQRGGTNKIDAAATVTKISVLGGELDIEGEGYTITELEMQGGIVRDQHNNSGGVEWTTIDMQAGTLDLTGTDQSGRSITTLNLYGGTITANWSILSAGTVLEPIATTPQSITVAPA